MPVVTRCVPRSRVPQRARLVDIESAFALHLRTLREKLGGLAQTLVVAAPEMSHGERQTLLLETVHAHEGIVFCPLFPASCSRLAFYKHLPSVLPALRVEVEKADVVHAGPSRLHRPFEFPALLMGKRHGKKTICVTDIDAPTARR